jgi:hypothetical protein
MNILNYISRQGAIFGTEIENNKKIAPRGRFELPWCRTPTGFRVLS